MPEVAAGMRISDAVAQVIGHGNGDLENVLDVETALRRIQYRPGWRFRAEDAGAGRVRILLRAWVHDSFFTANLDDKAVFEVGPESDPLWLEQWQTDTLREMRGYVAPRLRPTIRCSIPAVEIHASTDVALPVRTDALIGHVRHWLGEVELHERDEWLRVDGEMPFNPHAGEADRG